MSEYLVPITGYNNRDKYTQAYFDNNFYTEIYTDPHLYYDKIADEVYLISLFPKSRNYEVIRRGITSREDETSCNVNPKDRRMELYTVLKHFVNVPQIKHNEFEGYNKVIYEYEHDTFCICGQRSKLYICEHKKTGLLFYMGSECIKLFQPSFEPEGDKGVCSICAVNLRMKSNKEKGKNRNYDGNCKKICNLCNPVNKLITMRFLNTWIIYKKRMPILSFYFRHFKVLLNMKKKNNEIMSNIFYFYKDYMKIKEEKKEKEKGKHMKILQLLRKQTDYMLKYK